MIGPIRLQTLVLVAVLSTSACGGGSAACTVGDNSTCGSGLTCEAVMGGSPACFEPVEIHGRVYDAISSAGIGGASIVAVDINGAARSDVAFSMADGTYVLPVPTTRNATGTPVNDQVTLRVAAADYQPFPLAPRSALPIELASAMAMSSTAPWIVASALTDVALIELDPAQRGGTTIAGAIQPAVAGALVVATAGGAAASSAISDARGAFTLFNVPAGDIQVEGYVAGHVITPAMVTVASQPITGVILMSTTAGLATVTGRVEIVNAPGGAVTSVILVVESTFDETVVHGEAPYGLRVGGVSTAFTIPDVPPGRYVVLAAYENDGIVRDPDTNLGATQIVHIQVSGANFTVPDPFKLTGALAVVSPGASMLEVVTTATPTLTFAQDSGANGYDIQIIDALGNVVHSATEPDTHGSGDIQHVVTGVTWQNGMIYQFRAKSFTTTPSMLYLSATEDLRGVFQYLPQAP